MSKNEMHQDAAILNHLKNYAEEIAENDQVEGIDESHERHLEQDVPPSESCQVDVDGLLSLKNPDLANKSEK